ncbi:CC0125/CC1285 family lipoprotein [Sphingomonas japonica]|uniref:DUF4136 domain-containing protein n=1 Tax=Sphingomonas japonica TaxID=511662 RepID=A0ABX0U161_9SPHN|nr:hypothetical protein [Sphingomonas japonica]NIJ22532.1 hypothetical protein [Sphingomonas japonica]
MLRMSPDRSPAAGRSRPVRAAILASVLVGSAVLAACATPTPYQPAVGQGFSRAGYWDEQIERDRFRVSFAGNSLTARETVERYLLFRAAQLTLEQGADHFVLVDRDTERKSRTYVNQPFGPGFGYGGFGGWSPYWRYHNPRWGWRGWNPYWGDPFFGNQIDVRQIDRYEAAAEIVIGRGPKPVDNVRAFDARDVIDKLGPSVRMPEPR